MTTLGGPFPGASPTGKHKWYGGLLGGDGCIYGIPQCAVSVIKIDPKNQQVSTIGKLPGGGWKWHGGVTGPDGCIYGIPANADTVLKIDPMTQEVMTLPFRYTCHHRDDGKYSTWVVCSVPTAGSTASPRTPTACCASTRPPTSASRSGRP